MTEKLSFECKSIIFYEQHEFSAGRFTTNNLFIYQQFITDTLEGGLQVDSIHTDFSKAFDKVSYNILLYKLNSMG